MAQNPRVDAHRVLGFVCLHSKRGTSHLWSSPVVFPSYKALGVLRQSSAAYKAL
jgi:hypothetical protein